MSDRIRTYVFTLNNYTNDEIELITSGDYSHLIFGKEVGESGTPHLQGYVRFENAKTMSAVHKLKGWKRSALKPCKNDTYAILYCKKGEQPHAEWEALKDKGPNYGKNAEVTEIGEPKNSGKRTDLDEVYAAVKSGTSVDEIAWNDPGSYLRCFKVLDKLEDIRLRQSKRDFMTEGIWIFGETGQGKSKWAFENHPDAYVYPFDNGWCDAYKQQHTMIVDDFRGQIPYNELLRMVDRNANYFLRRRCREPMPFTSKKVIITSSMKPSEVYTKLSEQDKLEQLYRRFKIYECKNFELIEYNENALDSETMHL